MKNPSYGGRCRTNKSCCSSAVVHLCCYLNCQYVSTFIYAGEGCRTWWKEFKISQWVSETFVWWQWELSCRAVDAAVVVSLSFLWWKNYRYDPSYLDFETCLHSRWTSKNKQTNKKTNIIPANVRLERPKNNTFPLINRGWPQRISWPVTVFKMAGQHGGFTKPDTCSDVFLADEFQV